MLKDSGFRVTFTNLLLGMADKNCFKKVLGGSSKLCVKLHREITGLSDHWIVRLEVRKRCKKLYRCESVISKALKGPPLICYKALWALQNVIRQCPSILE